MVLKVHADGHLTGQKKEFTRYERDLLSGKIPCPFTVEFLDTEYTTVYTDCTTVWGNRIGKKFVVSKKGKVTYEGMQPLTTDGKPKARLF